MAEPHANLQLSFVTVEQGRVMHRIHPAGFRAAQFNPTVQGNARFSPIRTASGKVIPTLYAGSTFDCAAMETVFHDVPFAPGFKTYPKQKLAGHLHSKIEFCADVKLVDLTSKALRLLGISRNQLIDTEKDQYPATRQWAAAIHAQCPEAQGLYWVSRQDDTAVAIMLFGDRVPAKTVIQHAAGRDLLTSDAARSDLLALADKIGVLIVPGR